jgi:hypothetical protein
VYGVAEMVAANFECEASFADLIVETLQNTGDKHRYGVVGDAIRQGRGGDVWEAVSKSVSNSRGRLLN